MINRSESQLIARDQRNQVSRVRTRKRTQKSKDDPALRKPPGRS